MNRIFVAALKEETPNLDYFFYTGVGKINASYNLMKLINKFNPKEVINYGTAGSLKTQINWISGMHKVLSTRYGCQITDGFRAWPNTI